MIHREGICISALCALFLVVGCKGDTMDTPEAGKAFTVALGGAQYRMEWVGPTSPPSATWESAPIRSTGPYHDHVNPLYNIQEDLPHSPPEDDDWGGLWQQLAGGLAGRVEWYCLVAYDGDALAGMIRFFPKTLTRPRYGSWSPEDHRRDWSDEILWIGAACVDARGADDGLDAELVRRVVRYARQEGYRRVQALGWGEVPIYAMWGQSFAAPVYESEGFHAIATLDGSGLKALPDMFAGRHGTEAQKRVLIAMAERGLTREQAEQFRIMQLDLP